MKKIKLLRRISLTIFAFIIIAGMNAYAEYEKECRKRFAETLATRDICLAAGRCGETNDTGVIIHAKTDN